jgi:hypothetical protein
VRERRRQLGEFAYRGEELVEIAEQIADQTIGETGLRRMRRAP